MRLDARARQRDRPGRWLKGRDGQSVSLASLSPPSQAISCDPVNVSGGNLLAHWRRTLGGRSDVQAGYDRTYLRGPQIGESRNTFDVDFLHHWAWFPRQQLTWGLGARVAQATSCRRFRRLDHLPHDKR